MADVDLEAAALRVQLFGALAPRGSELLELHHAGVAPLTIAALYPAEFDHTHGVDMLPKLLGVIDLPALRELLADHAAAIAAGWEHEKNGVQTALAEKLGLQTFSPSSQPDVITIVKESATFRALVKACVSAWFRREALGAKAQILNSAYQRERTAQVQAFVVIFFFFPSLTAALPKMSAEAQRTVEDLLHRYVDLLIAARQKLSNAPG